MLGLNRLTGTHRLRADRDAAAVLNALEEVLAADPAVAGTFRDGDRIEFAMNRQRWDRFWILLGIRPRGGRIAGGTITAFPDEPRDLAAYDLRLDAGRPLLVDYGWVTLALGLAVVDVVRPAFPFVLAALFALRFLIRQGETEWMHDIIRKAAGEAAPSTAISDAIVQAKAETQLTS